MVIPEWISGPILLGAVGWLISKWWERRTDKDKARRTELRQKIDETCTVVGTIERNAHNYFVLPVNDLSVAALARSILRDLTLLANKCHDIDCAMNGAYASGRCKAFKQAVTLNDFQSVRRQPVLPNDLLLDAITQKARSLEANLERAFRTEFNDNI